MTATTTSTRRPQHNKRQTRRPDCCMRHRTGGWPVLAGWLGRSSMRLEGWRAGQSSASQLGSTAADGRRGSRRAVACTSMSAAGGPATRPASAAYLSERRRRCTTQRCLHAVRPSDRVLPWSVCARATRQVVSLQPAVRAQSAAASKQC